MKIEISVSWSQHHSLPVSPTFANSPVPQVSRLSEHLTLFPQTPPFLMSHSPSPPSSDLPPSSHCLIANSMLMPSTSPCSLHSPSTPLLRLSSVSVLPSTCQIPLYLSIYKSVFRALCHFLTFHDNGLSKKPLLKHVRYKVVEEPQRISSSQSYLERTDSQAGTGT